MKTCDEILAILSPYIDNELSDKDAKAVREHLQNCLHCHEHHQSLQSMITCINTLPEMELPTGFHEELMHILQDTQASEAPAVTHIKKPKKIKSIKKKRISFAQFTALAAGIIATLFVVNIVLSYGLRVTTQLNEPLVTQSTGAAVATEAKSLPVYESEPLQADMIPTTFNPNAAFADDTVKNCTLTVTVAQCEDAVRTIEQMPGYNASADIRFADEYSDVFILRRVENQSYGDTIAQVSSLGEVQSQSTAATKLTYEIMQAQASLRAKDEEVARLFSMLEASESLEAMTAIELQLSSTEDQRDEIRSLLLNYHNQIAYPTIEIVLRDESVPTDTTLSFGTRIKDTFLSSLEYSVNTLEGILFTISAVLLPVLIIILVGVVLFKIFKKVKGRERHV